MEREALRLYAQGVHVGDDLATCLVVWRCSSRRCSATRRLRWRGESWARGRITPATSKPRPTQKRAVDNANHLTTRERYLALGSYHTTAGAGFDSDQAIVALKGALEVDSTDGTVTVNLAIQLSAKGLTDSALAFAVRAARAGNTYGMLHTPPLSWAVRRISPVSKSWPSLNGCLEDSQRHARSVGTSACAFAADQANAWWYKPTVARRNAGGNNEPDIQRGGIDITLRDSPHDG